MDMPALVFILMLSVGTNSAINTNDTKKQINNTLLDNITSRSDGSDTVDESRRILGILISNTTEEIKNMNSTHSKVCCSSIKVTLKGAVKRSQGGFAGRYHFEGKVNGRQYWIDKTRKRAIWYVSRYRDWAIGYVYSLGGTFRSFMGVSDSGSKCPYDENITWKYWNKSWVATNGVKMDCGSRGADAVDELEEELRTLNAKDNSSRNHFVSKLNNIMKELKTEGISKTDKDRVIKVTTDFTDKLGEVLRNDNSLPTISVSSSEVGILVHRSNGAANRTIVAEDISNRVSMSINTPRSNTNSSRFLAKAFLPSNIVPRNQNNIVLAIGYRDSYVFDSSNSTISGAVLSISIDHHTTTSLSSPISLHFRTDTNKTGIKQCVFWNFSRNIWDGRGCIKVGETEDGIVTCKCNHMTNFGVLLDVSQTGYSTDFLSKYTYVASSLSIVALAITILLHTILAEQHVRDRVRSKILVRLSVALILLLALFPILIKNTSGKSGDVPCKIKGGCLHYFLLVAFMCMGTEAWELKRNKLRNQEPDIENRHEFEEYHDSRFLNGSLGATLIFPLIVVAASGIKFHDYYGTEKHCFVRGVPFFVFVLAPIIIVAVFSIGVIFYARVAMFREEMNVNVTAQWKFVCGKIVLFGVTWIVGAPGVGILTPVFQTWFTVLNTLQGFFILLFVLLERKSREELIHKKLCCIGRNQQGEDMTEGPEEHIPMKPNPDDEESGNKGQGRWNEVLQNEVKAKCISIRKKKSRAKDESYDV